MERQADNNDPQESEFASVPPDSAPGPALGPAWRILKNSTALSLAVLLERGVALFLPWYVARMQGRQDWGIYSTALAFVMVGAPIATWGLTQLLPREIGRDRAKAGRLLANAGVVAALASILVTAVGTVIVILLDYPQDVRMLIILGLVMTLLPRAEYLLSEATVNGLEKMEWIVFVRFPATLLRVILSIGLLALGCGLHVLFWLWAAYYLLAFAAYLTLFHTRVSGFSLKLDAHLIRSLAVRALPFVATLFVGETLTQLDRIFLSKWDGTDAVGAYAVGIMLVQTLYLIATAIMNALYPALSRAYHRSKQQFSQVVSQLFRLLFAAVFPVMLSAIALARPLILLVFGDDYGESIPVLQITALALLPSFLGRLMYRTLLASDNERIAFWVSLVSGVLGLVLNIILIPRYGLLGASVVSVTVALAGLVLSMYNVARGVVRFDFVQALLLPLFCAGVSAAIYLILAQWNEIVAWLLSLAGFLALAFGTGVVKRQDLNVLPPRRPRG